MRVWRISLAKFAHSAFSGEGARLFAARWNLAGSPMVYASSSLALAAIEFFVHLDPSQIATPLVSVSAELPDSLSIERIDPAKLPRDWRRIDHPHLQQLGTDWLKSLRSVALIVPSAVIPGESNILLNPAHGDFKEIVISKAAVFQYDERMFQPKK
jgi:RES domain-containing protein